MCTSHYEMIEAGVARLTLLNLQNSKMLWIDPTGQQVGHSEKYALFEVVF